MKNKVLKNDHFTRQENLPPMHKGPGIAPRLFFMIFALLTLMVISSLVAFWRNRTVHDAFEKILYEIPHERAINDVQTAITDYIMPANDYLITGDPVEILNRDILDEKVRLAFVECYRLARDDETPLVKRVEDDFIKIKNLSDEIFSFNVSTDRELAGKIMKNMDKLAIDSRIHVRDLLKMHDQHMASASYEAEQAWRSTRRWMTSMFFLALILGMGLATYISLSILRPLKILDTTATKIAGGDLSGALVIERKGELTSLAESFNQMIISLRHQIETSKTILNAIADPVFTVDNNMTITYFSNACERLTGFSAEEALGQRCRDIFKSNICENLCAIRRSARQDKPVLNVEIQMKNKESDTIPIMASASCLKDWKGNIMGGCEVFRDISDWKRMTKELKDAEQQLILSERLAVLGRLASSVGHELRNPLAVVQNSAYYLKSKIGEDQPKLIKHIHMIENEIDSANKIIEDLLGFSRTKKPELIPLYLNSTIESSLHRIRVREDVKIDLNLDPDIPNMMGDKNQLHQVLVNLISNAEHAIGKNSGQITITTKKRGENIELKISDTGCGIAEEDIGKLFDPFFTTKTKGIGLGLAITKSIIKNHKGKIDLTSVKGKGTDFIITFKSQTQ
ncbi:PAS domain-containing protein [bacterium]|nr:PAS domain-containing protein [bacterium]